MSVRTKRRASAERTFPKPISTAINNFTGQLGITKKLRQYSVLTLWEEIVGEQIAKVTTAQRVENGVLYVGVATAPWRAELTMRKREIMQKIQLAVDKNAIKDIRFR